MIVLGGWRGFLTGRAEKYDIDGNLVMTLPNCGAR